jgi:hypothetical protein
MQRAGMCQIRAKQQYWNYVRADIDPVVAGSIAFRIT